MEERAEDRAMNEAILKKARERFTQEEGEELAASCDYLLKAVERRRETIARGEAPVAFGRYDRETMVRILTCKVTFTYNAIVEPDEAEAEELGDEAGVWMEERHELAEEAAIRQNLIKAYAQYLYEAATRGKSVKSSATRMYLKAWKMLTGTGMLGVAGDNPAKRFDAEDALKIMNLEAVATERLGLDILEAELPEFTVKRG